jgi:hypothetical protein
MEQPKTVDEFWRNLMLYSVNLEPSRTTKKQNYAPLFAHVLEPKIYKEPPLENCAGLRNALRSNDWEWFFETMRRDGGFLATTLAAVCDHEDVDDDLRLHIARSVGGLCSIKVDGELKYLMTNQWSTKQRVATFIRYVMNVGVETPWQLGFAAIAHNVSPAAIARSLVAHRKFMRRCGITFEVGDDVGPPVAGANKMVWFNYKSLEVQRFWCHGDLGICGRPGQVITKLRFEV